MMLLEDLQRLPETGKDDPFETPDVRLRCPRCLSDLDSSRLCDNCGFHLKREHGITLALPPERVAHFATFISEYESIRAAEGRGSTDEHYYLGLPYRDLTGNNNGQWAIRAKSYDHLVRHALPESETGRSVLDLGAGNCWLSYRLAESGHNPVAVDLMKNVYDGLGSAAHYERHLGVKIPRFQAELENLPFQSRQFDVVIFNASFHYAEDYEVVLREALRCVKTNGIVVICDTPWYSHESHGNAMLDERRAHFRERFHTASDSLKSKEFLTDERLDALASALSISWTVFRPWHGWRWAARPWLAKLRNKREPSSFRIYVARKVGTEKRDESAPRSGSR